MSGRAKIIFASMMLLATPLAIAAPCTASDASTLATAINSLNSGNCDSSTITLTTAGTITLSSSLPVIKNDVTIHNTSDGAVTIDGAGSYAIFNTKSASVNLISTGSGTIVLQNGMNAGGNGAAGRTANDGGGGGGLGAGGAIYVDQGETLTLANITITGNTAQGGNGAGKGSASVQTYYGGGGGGGASWSTQSNKNGSSSGSGGGYTAFDTYEELNPGYGGGENPDSEFFGAGGQGSGAHHLDGNTGGNTKTVYNYATSTNLIANNGGGVAQGGPGGSFSSSAAGGAVGGGGAGFGGGGGGATVLELTASIYAAGGNGGLGGGGGGGSTRGSGGTGGYYGGDGDTHYGGGGAGIGGAIFLGDSATLNVGSGVSIHSNTVIGGTAGGGYAEPGSALASDVFLLQNAQVVFNGSGDTSVDFSISGDPLAPTGHLDNGVSIAHGGLVTYQPTYLETTLAHTYRGPTDISDGILVTHAQTLPDDEAHTVVVGDSGTLHFYQASGQDGAFAGVISGNGIISTEDSEDITTLTGDSSGFSGTVAISSGELKVGSGSDNSSAALGGAFTVSGTTANGILSGYGTVSTAGSHVTVEAEGIVHPGGSIGILTDAGDFIQNGGTLEINILGLNNIVGTNNSQLYVEGQATISPTGTTVNVISDDGGYYLGGWYTAMEAVGGISGNYSNSTIQNAHLSPYIHATAGYDENGVYYGSNKVYIDFQSALLGLTTNANQRGVAQQLFSVIAPDPSSDIGEFLFNFSASLPVPYLAPTLDQLSGASYLQMMPASELSNHQFIRQLYTPLRPVLTHASDRLEPIWMKIGNSHTFFNTSSTAIGYKAIGSDLTVGAQVNLNPHIISGIAGSYRTQNYQFLQGDLAHSNTLLGAVYGAYLGPNYYFLGNWIMGPQFVNMHRNMSIGTTRYTTAGNQNSVQNVFYAEAGIDLESGEVLIQPFIGVESNHYVVGKVRELPSLHSLHIRDMRCQSLNNNVGVRFSAHNLAYDLSFTLDLDWQHRWGSRTYQGIVNFDNFGSTFPLHSAVMSRSSVDGNIYVTKKINRFWSMYLSANGRSWRPANTYDMVVGLSAIL